MHTSLAMNDPALSPARPHRMLPAALALSSAVGALVAYKANGAIAALERASASGKLAAKTPLFTPESVPVLLRAPLGVVNYFAWVGLALLFGILIGALTRALAPEAWLARSLGRDGWRGQLTAAVAGAPLMLCSCCAAPVFEGVYDRTRRLGPALALMLAAPGLNPAALALTFLLFPPQFGWLRLAVSLGVVLVVSAVAGRAADATPAGPCAAPAPSGSPELLSRLKESLWVVGRRSLPAIALGVLISAALLEALPVSAITAAASSPMLVILVVAAVATLIALPTFAEIPLAALLLAAGAPEGAALAMLVAGPIVNLPSLIVLGRRTRLAAVIVGAAVFGLAALCGAALSAWPA